MAKRRGQQTARVVINVTPEQLAATELMLAEAKRRLGIGKNTALISLLELACKAYEVEWPEFVSQQGRRTDLENS
jgi:hypothetical protein